MKRIMKFELLELFTIGLNENFKQFIRNLRQNKEENGDEGEKKSEIVRDFRISNDGLIKYINLEIKKVMTKYDSVDGKFLIR